MKIQELLNLDKALAEKKQELEKLRQESLNFDKILAEKKQRLENLRKEAEKLKLMIAIDNKENSKDMIDITNVYVYQSTGSKTKQFIEKEKIDLMTINLINIFSKKIVNKTDFARFIVSENPSPLNYVEFIVKHIREVYPEVNVYPNNMVPKLLLQKLYYRANGIDEKVLKRGTLKEEI